MLARGGVRRVWGWGGGRGGVGPYGLQCFCTASRRVAMAAAGSGASKTDVPATITLAPAAAATSMLLHSTGETWGGGRGGVPATSTGQQNIRAQLPTQSGPTRTHLGPKPPSTWMSSVGYLARSAATCRVHTHHTTDNRETLQSFAALARDKEIVSASGAQTHTDATHM